MNRPLDLLQLFLKHSTHNARQLAQILAQTITTGLINTTFTWNYVIRAYSKSPTPVKAILIYNYFIKASSILPDNHTYPSLLHACTRLSLLLKGKEVHAHVIKVGLIDYGVYLHNSLIHLYGSIGSVNHARQCFDEMPQRDLVSWNSLLATYGIIPDLQIEVLALFKEMVVLGVGADEITLVILLSACAEMRGLTIYERGAHAYAVKMGIRWSLNLGNSLLQIYAKGGNMDMAWQLFHEMKGQRDVVSGTILINGYVELGSVDEAREIFDQMDVRDLVTWNSMINGYVKVKRWNEMVKLFEKMGMDGVSPDETTMVILISACASLSDLQLGRRIHRFIHQRNITLDVFLSTSLINMYSKCGSLEDALVTFYKMECKDVFAWTAVITGLADYGHGKEALVLFEKMELEGIKPNEATFLAVLMACSHSGLVQEGCLLFDRMVKFYKIQTTIAHFGCLIDILSRAGLLCQAQKFVGAFPPEERLIAYKTLLNACMRYSDFDIGEKISKELTGFRPQNQGVYILLSNFYASAGRWDKVVEVRKIMEDSNKKREAGISDVHQLADSYLDKLEKSKASQKTSSPKQASIRRSSRLKAQTPHLLS